MRGPHAVGLAARRPTAHTPGGAEAGLGGSGGVLGPRGELQPRRPKPPPGAAPSTPGEDGARRGRTRRGRAYSPHASPAVRPASVSSEPPAPPPPWCGSAGSSSRNHAPRDLPQRRGALTTLPTAQARAAPRHHQSSPQLRRPPQPGRRERPDCAIAGGGAVRAAWAEPTPSLRDPSPTSSPPLDAVLALARRARSHCERERIVI